MKASLHEGNTQLKKREDFVYIHIVCLSQIQPEKALAGKCCKGSWFPRVQGQVPVCGVRADRVALGQDPGADGSLC